MAKGDKFYFDNYKACAELAKKAAAYLVECLENYDPDKNRRYAQGNAWL